MKIKTKFFMESHIINLEDKVNEWLEAFDSNAIEIISTDLTRMDFRDTQGACDRLVYSIIYKAD